MRTFYNKFKEEEKKEQEKLKEQEQLQQQLLQQQLLQQQLNNQTFNNQPIIIQDKSTFKNLKILISAFFIFIKGLFYLGITVFSSIGLTVLLNESLRSAFIDFVKSVI